MNAEDTGVRDELARQRTELANERTLLAYIRTALAVLVTAVALLKFFESAAVHLAGWTGLAMFPIILVIGGARYLKMRASLRQ